MHVSFSSRARSGRGAATVPMFSSYQGVSLLSVPTSQCLLAKPKLMCRLYVPHSESKHLVHGWLMLSVISLLEALNQRWSTACLLKQVRQTPDKQPTWIYSSHNSTLFTVPSVEQCFPCLKNCSTCCTQCSECHFDVLTTWNIFL